MKPPVCAGLVQPAEGARLAGLAGRVGPGRAIVEVGSHTGLSTVWMARGGRAGLGARVVAVDPWGDPRPGTLDDPFALETGDAVLETFLANIAAEKIESRVTPLRATGDTIAALWVKPVGLLFVDAVHDREHVLADVGAWDRHLPVGAWLALHDFTTDPEHAYFGVSEAAAEIVASGDWGAPVVTEYLWTAQRVRA